MQHRDLVSSQPPRPGAMAIDRLAQRGEPDIVLSRERDEIAGNVRIAEITRFSHTPTLSAHLRPGLGTSSTDEMEWFPIR